MISVNQLSVYFGGFALFDEISFLINPKDRIGLIGKNGAGKSTLLKILSGNQLPTNGSVSKPNGLTIGYLPQHISVLDKNSLIEEVELAFDELKGIEKRLKYLNQYISDCQDYHSDAYSDAIHELTDKTDRYHLLGGGNYRGKAEQTLKGLGFENSDFDRPTSEFSGGWRMRIELAKILLKDPDVFLLDEPTNHLDIESIQWLEDFLKGYRGAVLLISHDKTFLNQITTRTIEISLGKIYDYKASYNEFVELRLERHQQQLNAYNNQQKFIDDTEKFIDRFRSKATKAVQVQSRIKQLDKIDRIEVDEFDNSRLNIKFPPAPHSGNITVEGKNISKSFGDLEVIKNIDFQIVRGEKIALVGRNGEGKTTLARMILNEVDYQGDIKLGHQVQIGYFAQNQAEKLNEQLTVFETIDKEAVGEIRTKIRDLLGAFMFSGEDVDKKVSVLSGGERTRLAMVQLLLKPVNFLIMDEPTNHLDIRSKELLKQALIKYEGTVLIVSHDREFLNGLSTRILEIRQKTIKEHLVNIFEFLKARKVESLMEFSKRATKDLGLNSEDVANSSSKSAFEERKELNKTLKKAQKSIAENEQEIALLESKLEDINTKMSLGDNQDAEIFHEYEKIQKQLELIMASWEKNHEDLDVITEKINNLK